MKYPVMNLRPMKMGGLLEDYQKEISDFKAKLNQLNPPNPGAYGYPPPPSTYPPASPGGREGPPGPSGTPGVSSWPRPTVNPFGAGAGPLPMSVATGGNPTPPPGPEEPEGLPFHQEGDVKRFSCGPDETLTPSGCVPNVQTVDYRIPRLPTPPMSVATGGNPTGTPPPPPPSRPDVATPGRPCGPNETWTPSGCLPNVETGGRSGLVQTPPPPPPPPSTTTSMGPSSTPSWNTAPGVTRPSDGAPVASVDCGPNAYFDGRQCQPNNKNSMNPSGLISAATSFGPSGAAATTGNFSLPPGGDFSTASLLGQVRLMARPEQLGRPRLLRQVVLLRTF